jgi:DNA-binding transcriptional MerR regulator
MTQYSISQAARMLGVHRATLHRWIERRVVPEPITQKIGGLQIRYWNDDGLAILKQYKIEEYRKKPRRKAKKQTSKSS